MTEDELNALALGIKETLEEAGVSSFLVLHMKKGDGVPTSRVRVHSDPGESSNLLQTIWRGLGLFFLHHYEHPVSDLRPHFGAGADVAECVLKTVLAAATIPPTPPDENVH